MTILAKIFVKFTDMICEALLYVLCHLWLFYNDDSPLLHFYVIFYMFYER